MTGGIVFILYGATEAHYAGNMARALSPHFTAVPVPAGDRALHIGTGATCVVVWSRGMDESNLAFLSSLRPAHQNYLLCVFEGAAAPATLQHLPQVSARGIGFAVPDSEIVAEALRHRRASSEANANRSLRSPALDAKPSASGEHGRGQFVVRSAWGFAATMAVVSVVAPFIGARAGATNISPNPDRSPADLSVDGNATADLNHPVDTIQPSEAINLASPPLAAAVVFPSSEQATNSSFEITMPPSAANDGSFELLMASTTAATDNVELAFNDMALDVKTTETIAAIASQATVDDRKVDGALPPPRHGQKPQLSSHQPNQEARG